MAIGIVTAFFDIGREDWAKRPNTPAWLARGTSTRAALPRATRSPTDKCGTATGSVGSDTSAGRSGTRECGQDCRCDRQASYLRCVRCAHVSP